MNPIEEYLRGFARGLYVSCVHKGYTWLMDTVTSSVSARELRTELSSIVGRVAFGHERIGLTRNGKLAAVVIGVEDLELLEQLEDAQDLAAYRAANVEDDGSRISLTELRDELGV